jgi:hypothetical protein
VVPDAAAREAGWEVAWSVRKLRRQPTAAAGSSPGSANWHMANNVLQDDFVHVGGEEGRRRTMPGSGPPCRPATLHHPEPP